MINSNEIITPKISLEWKYFAATSQSFSIKVYPHQVGYASLDILRNNWENSFCNKGIPWVALAIRDKQSEAQTVCLFNDEVLKELQKFEGHEATKQILENMKLLYTPTEKNVSIIIAIESYKKGAAFFIKRHQMLEDCGLKDFFSDHFYKSIKRNCDSFDKIYEYSKTHSICIRSLSCDAMIEGAFGEIRSLESWRREMGAKSEFSGKSRWS